METCDMPPTTMCTCVQSTYMLAHVLTHIHIHHLYAPMTGIALLLITLRVALGIGTFMLCMHTNTSA